MSNQVYDRIKVLISERVVAVTRVKNMAFDIVEYVWNIREINKEGEAVAEYTKKDERWRLNRYLQQI